MSDRLTAEFLIARAKANEEYLSHPGTINYFDEDGNFLIAPKTPYHIAQKRAWEKRIGWDAQQDGSDGI